MGGWTWGAECARLRLRIFPEGQEPAAGSRVPAPPALWGDLLGFSTGVSLLDPRTPHLSLCLIRVVFQWAFAWSHVSAPLPHEPCRGVCAGLSRNHTTAWGFCLDTQPGLVEEGRHPHHEEFQDTPLGTCPRA